MEMIMICLQVLLVIAASPLYVGIIKKIKAWGQLRQGASVLQPYRDIYKLLNKDEVISCDCSWIFRLTPYIVYALSVIVAANIPVISSAAFGMMRGDILLLVYLLAASTFFRLLAALDSGSPFGGFAASREMTIAVLAEGGLIFSLLAIGVLAGSFNLFAAINITADSWVGQILPRCLALISFFIVLLAETARYPFDNPDTHLELTMIHEAMVIEYSGKRLALLEWAAYNKLLVFSLLAVNIFFPWGIAMELTIVDLILATFIVTIKLLFVCLVISVLEATIAKFRFFRLPDLLFVALIIGAIAVGMRYSL